MIVWLASFPRSGNTFLRILLHRLYRVRSSVVYDVDGVAERLGESLVGFEQQPMSYDEMRASDAVQPDNAATMALLGLGGTRG